MLLRVAILCPLVAACSVMDLNRSLAPQGDWAEIPERARIVELGEARLDPEGPLLVRDDPQNGTRNRWTHDLVVMEPGDEVGVLVPLAEVDLLVYLDRADLESRVVEPIDMNGVRLEVDLVVRVLEEEADRVLVEFGDVDVSVEAWVPRRSIDQAWIPEADTKPHNPQGDIWLRGWTAILDQPGGEAFAWVDGFSWRGEPEPEIFWLPAIALDEAHDGHREVLLDRGGFALRGFVAEADLAERPNGGRGRGGNVSCGCGGSWMESESTSEPTVPTGTDLFVEPHGPWIGRTHSPIYRQLGGGADETWRSIELDTPWGLATVWLETDLD